MFLVVFKKNLLSFQDVFLVCFSVASRTSYEHIKEKVNSIKGQMMEVHIAYKRLINITYSLQ